MTKNNIFMSGAEKTNHNIFLSKASEEKQLFASSWNPSYFLTQPYKQIQELTENYINILNLCVCNVLHITEEVYYA